jgi:hypothetical protein
MTPMFSQVRTVDAKSASFHIRRAATRVLTRARILRWLLVEELRRVRSAANLRNYEHRVYSQNGEDGILEEIFQRIGTTNRYFVEFGIEDGAQCNCRRLVESGGWSGLWIEASSQLAHKARQRFSGFPVQVRQGFVTRDNIADLLRDAGVPQQPDLLSIDIDGNDYWVWESISRPYAPRVVLIEYNASITPGGDWVMPYRSDHVWDGSNHFGASLDAMDRLGERLGYVLVGCDSRGVNAFFVRKDEAERAFPDAGRGSRYHYVSPKYHGVYFGHPPRRRAA